MPACILDGKTVAQRLRKSIADRAAALRQAGKRARLDAVLAESGGDAAARVYAHNQERMCSELGIEYHLHQVQGGDSRGDLESLIRRLSTDAQVHALMVHLPLPDGVDPYPIQSLIAPEKDVEGVNPANIGNIVYGRSSIAPCTALAVLRLIESTGQPLRGRFAVCVGASDLVGKPVAVLLMRQEATVVSCTKFTQEITGLTRRADVLVSATGVPGLVRGDWVRPGAVVIDVGICRVIGADGKSRTVGDLAFDEVREVAGWVTPVPGGVGPVTVAVLLENVVTAAERR